MEQGDFRPSLGDNELFSFPEEDVLDMAADEDFDLLDWPDERELTEEEVDIAREDAKTVANAVKLVAIDCDLTLLGIHTGGGYWSQSAAELATHLRPVFRVFIPEVLGLGCHVAVVTFSPQPQLIKEALEIGLSQEGCDASEVVVMGRDGRAVISGEDGSTCQQMDSPRSCTSASTGRRRGRNHKQKHISTVIKHFHEAGITLLPNEIFLVDDDSGNVEAAQACGMNAVVFNPDEPYRILQDGIFNPGLRHTL
jgi:hypothetical protein